MLYAILRNKMLEILRETNMLELYGGLAENFKMSQCWLIAFLKRYRLSL